MGLRVDRASSSAASQSVRQEKDDLAMTDRIPFENGRYRYFVHEFGDFTYGSSKQRQYPACVALW
jgi:hypothetical protein